MDSYDILVIILSITLAVFLIVSIVATVFMIQILKRIRSISYTAQQAADNVVEFTEQLRSAGKVTAIGSAVAQVFDFIKKGRK